MIPTRCTTLLPAGLALAAVTAAAGADLFVAGTIGEVYKGNPQTGEFAYFGGICLSPVHALAIDDAHVYAGDLNGGILRLDLETGAFLDLYWVPGDATDLVVHGGDLLVSTSGGEVHRVDPLSGTVERTLASPIQIQAMAVLGDELFIAGTIGEVYKGSAETGNFEPFGGICLGPVQALALGDATIYAGDAVGGVVSFDLETGAFLGAFFAPDGVTAMVMHGPDLLVSELSGAVHRIDPADGTLLDTLTSPITVDAMELVEIAGDLDDDGIVGILDFLALLAAWGPCPDPPASCPGDLDGDGVVGILDLLILLSNWG